MSGLPVRLASLVVAVAAGALVASGALGSWSGFAAVVPASSGTARDVPLQAAQTVLVCPAGPVLADAGGTDEDFAADPAETATAVRATSSGPGARLVGAAVPAPDPLTDETEPAVPLEVLEQGPLQSITTSAVPSVTLVAVPDGSEQAGLSALRTSLTGSGDLRGLAATSCVEPSTRSYLVGGGVAPGRSGVIQLSNPGRTPVTVDLRVLTADGPVEPEAAQDLVVAPGSVRELLLEALVPAQPVLAVEVTAEGGRVAAAMADAELAGVVPGGVEVVPATAASTAAVLPAVPADTGQLSLRIAVPGQAPAVVGWRVEGPDGVVVPTADSVTSVQPGQAVDVPLSGLGAGPLNLVVESDQPVAVSATSVVGPVSAGPGAAGGAVERAYVVPAPAVVGSTVVTLPGAPVGATLVLSSGGDGDAEVTVTPLDDLLEDGQGVELEVVAGQALPVPADAIVGARAVRLDIRSGAVHAALALSAPAQDQAQAPLVSVVPVTVPAPVQRSLRVDTVEPGRWP